MTYYIIYRTLGLFTIVSIADFKNNAFKSLELGLNLITNLGIKFHESETTAFLFIVLLTVAQLLDIKSNINI